MRREVLLLGLLVGCQGAGSGETGGSYAFVDSDGVSTVSYSGQVFRHVLVSDLTRHLDGMTGRLNGGEFFPVEGQVAAELDFYLSFDSTIGGQTGLLSVEGFDAEQLVYDDLASGKNLREKLAGNDAVTDHIDWLTGFAGWDDTVASSPEELVDHWVARLDVQAMAWNTAPPLDPRGVPVESVFITPEGLDLQELLQKFLLGAVAYSQAADDYLDDDVDGKGLLADHSAVVEGKPYTALEHAWDEAFGYFGAATTAGSWTRDEVLGRRVDVDESGSIDLLTEVCWGHSVTAAKRDGAEILTDSLLDQAFGAFVEGRQFIADRRGGLTNAELDELAQIRDRGLDAWELALVTTVIHYINESLVDLDALGTEDYDFARQAKHWSEMKGYGLGLQFSPMRGAGSESERLARHAAVGIIIDSLGTGPTLDDGQRDAGRDLLLDARAGLVELYGLDPATAGGDDGLDGW